MERLSLFPSDGTDAQSRKLQADTEGSLLSGLRVSKIAETLNCPPETMLNQVVGT